MEHRAVSVIHRLFVTVHHTSLSTGDRIGSSNLFTHNTHRHRTAQHNTAQHIAMLEVKLFMKTRRNVAIGLLCAMCLMNCASAQVVDTATIVATARAAVSGDAAALVTFQTWFLNGEIYDSVAALPAEFDAAQGGTAIVLSHVQFLLTSGGLSVNSLPIQRVANVASSYGNNAALVFLLSEGLDVTYGDCRPLLEAAGNQHTSTVDLLIAEGSVVEERCIGRAIIRAMHTSNNDLFDALVNVDTDAVVNANFERNRAIIVGIRRSTARNVITLLRHPSLTSLYTSNSDVLMRNVIFYHDVIDAASLRAVYDDVKSTLCAVPGACF